MKQTDLQRYTEACNYPGVLDEVAVERYLGAYLSALGIRREIVRIEADWQPADYPSLQRNVNAILDDFAKRNPKALAALAALDARDARAARDASDALAALDARDARAARDASDARDARDARAARDASDARDALDASDARDARDALDARAARDARDALDASDASDALDARAARDARDARAALDASDARDAREAREALDARAARDARDASAALAASAAQDARAARDARDARDALDASAAQDARDIFSSTRRFTAWCIQSGGWGWWYSWELSWIATMAFGARQLKRPQVEAWTTPLLEAYIAGAWYLYWTDDTLFWVAKPTVHLDKNTTDRRLHNDKYAALESDVENRYFWHGVEVPAFVIVRPDWITLQHIDGELNAEARRVMIERYGEDRYIVDSGMKPVASDPRFGELFVKRMDAGRPIARCKVKNSTPGPNGSVKNYFLTVNPELYDGDAGRYPQAAVASTWRTTPSGKELAFKRWQDYNPVVET